MSHTFAKKGKIAIIFRQNLHLSVLTLYFFHNQSTAIQSTIPSRLINPLFIPRATRLGQNVCHQAISCPDTLTNRASEVTAGQSVARSMQPSTDVQTSSRLAKDHMGSKEAKEVEVELESSKEEVEKESIE